MPHFLIAIVCLLIIDEYTFQLRRRYIEGRQLRAWQKRVRSLEPPSSAAPRPAPRTINPFALSPEQEAVLERSRREAQERCVLWSELERSLREFRSSLKGRPRPTEE
ncbi:MAG: hypothetical protein WBE92_08460 [Steroidobacteraceae bacterium]